MELVTAAEMRELDRVAIETRKIPSLRLMENAGQSVARETQLRFGPLRGKTVTVVAGKGQNGGDGFVVARLLRRQGCKADVAVLAPLDALKGDAAVNFKKFRRAGGRCHALETAASLDRVLKPLLHGSDLLIDAIFGTGLNAQVKGLAADAIGLMNASGRPIVSIDLPSGLDADAGAVLGSAVRADLTVTLARPKRGLYVGAGPDHAGVVRIGDIGIPADLTVPSKSPVTLLDAAAIRPLMPTRRRTAHKGTFGHAGIIAGSAGKTGAAAMAAMAALRIGAGLVTVAAPRSVSDVVEAKLLEVMVHAVPETDARTLSKQAAESLLAFAETKTALALGPGIGTHPDTQALVHDLLAEIRKPMVLDADGLNAVAGHREILRRARAPLILTPHPGEMARLLGGSTSDVQHDRLGVAARFASEQRVFVVLKGAGTIVAGPDGRLAVNSTGNPGMGTAGTGDVLTGIIAGLLAQGLAAWDAACAGVYLHGLAGDLAAGEHGETGLIAGDVIRTIPAAVRQVL